MVRAGRELALPVGSISLLTLLPTHVKPVSNALMVLSNRERQARYRQRLKEAAERGVTPEMVVKAARLSFDAWRCEEPDTPPWDDFLKRCRKRGERNLWMQFVPDDPSDDFAEFGDDAELMRKVAAVARAVKLPPEA